MTIDFEIIEKEDIEIPNSSDIYDEVAIIQRKMNRTSAILEI
jgi:hypothetical protein